MIIITIFAKIVAFDGKIWYNKIIENSMYDMTIKSYHKSEEKIW